MSDVFPSMNPVNQAPRSHKTAIIVTSVVVGVLLAGLAAWSLVGQYNQLQHNDIAVDVTWKQAINQYTRRAELVPNLVTVVQGYAKHEASLFAEIAATRANLAKLTPASNTGERANIAQFELAQKQLAGQVSRLIAVAEGYPDLKASALYQDLMAQLEGTENRIAYARQMYIESVANHNFGMRRFPTNLMAAQAGLKLRETTDFADTAVVLKPLVISAK